MTDDTGILQHAAFSIPRYEDGYCLDDNARALLLMTLLSDAGHDDPAAVRALASRYLAFVNHALDRSSGRFRNFLSYARHWLEPRGSEDSHGRALWALGAVVGRAKDPGQRWMCSCPRVQFGTASSGGPLYPDSMRLEYMKATFAVVWVLVIIGVGFVAQAASAAGWGVVAALAVVPPIVMWRVWTAPRQSMSDSIRSAIR